MRLHVLSLPHTSTTDKYSFCAFTSNVVSFCNAMYDLGHEVFLYSGPTNQARCTEHISCITKKQMPDIAPTQWPEDKYFDIFNDKARKELAKRIQIKDFICLIGGTAQKSISDAFPNNICVEYAIGYGGCFAPYKVFPSYAWQNIVYGAQSGGNSHSIDGKFFDAVIPHMFDETTFPFREQKDGYFLFAGRLIERKGYGIAIDVCERLGLPLKIMGAGKPPAYGQYLGLLEPKERNDVMAGARAVFMPTQYTEPFGKVMVESFLCGTPVISTDFGAFVELNQNGLTGYRCNTIGQFMEATRHVDALDKQAIRDYAISKYSIGVVGLQYEQYFRRLELLWGLGFYDEGGEGLL